jgi:hypothetical protein
MGRFVELVVAAGADKYLPKETLIVGGFVRSFSFVRMGAIAETTGEKLTLRVRT